MKTLTNLIAAGATAGSLLLTAAPVQAQLTTTDGEQPGVLVCFYECKAGTDPSWWQEVTTLMITNPTATIVTPLIYFLDGNKNGIAKTFEVLEAFDVDEINVCRTLEADSRVTTTPSAGMIIVTQRVQEDFGGNLTVADPFTPYVYMKNVVGKFFKNVNEPFAGRVTGVAKTECRVVPRTMITPEAVYQQFPSPATPVINPILIEDTRDPFVP